VPIFFQGENHYIHTYKSGEGNPETLVLIHGYGGSSLFFYPMLKDLSKKYRVFCIDLLGMGLSSRAEFNCSTAEETIDYFVESFEKWREAMGLEEFQLAGHSFGGYMSAQYSLRYQNRVKKLFLLSPAGLTKYEQEITSEDIISKLGWFERKRYSYVQKHWTNRVTPAEFFRRNPVLGKIVLKRYLQRQFGNFHKQENLTKLLYKFCRELLMNKKGSEMAMFILFKPPVSGATLPLEEDIAAKLTIPVICYYGEKDWMDSQGAQRLETSRSELFKLKEIKNAGHQLTMQNPKFLTQDMLMEGLAMTDSQLIF